VYQNKAGTARSNRLKSRHTERLQRSSEELALQQQLKQFVQFTFNRFLIFILQTRKIQIRSKNQQPNVTL